MNKFFDTTRYKLLDWIDESKLDFKSLSQNRRAVFYLKDHLDKVDWYHFSLNPSAIDILEKNINKLKKSINENINAIELLRTNRYLINVSLLSSNDNGFELLREYKDNINWRCLTYKENAIDLIIENGDSLDDDYWISRNPACLKFYNKFPNKFNINWQLFPINPNGIELIKENLDKFDCWSWYYLCQNKNPESINIIEDNLDKLDDECWVSLCENENAIHLIKDNLDRLTEKAWCKLCRNPKAIDIIKDQFDYISKNTLIAQMILLNPNKDIIKLIQDNLNYFQNYILFNEMISKHKHSIDFLKKRRDLIDYKSFSSNEQIFTIDYQFYKERCSIYQEELMKNIFAPKNINKFEDWGF